MHTELDADTVSDLGLDPTGRDLDDRFPYTLENLTDQELLLLLFLSSQAEAYPDEAEAPGTSLWYEGSSQEFVRRYGHDGVDNLAAYVTGSHASTEDMIRAVRENHDAVLSIIAGTAS